VLIPAVFYSLMLASISRKVYEKAEEKFTPMIRLKGGGKVRDPKRKETSKAFRSEVFRLRAVGEGIFGAIKTRLNGKLRNLKLSCTQKESLLLVVCYVLRVLLAFLCFLLGIQRLRGRERVHWAVHNAAWAPR